MEAQPPTVNPFGIGLASKQRSSSACRLCGMCVLLSMLHPLWHRGISTAVMLTCRRVAFEAACEGLDLLAWCQACTVLELPDHAPAYGVSACSSFCIEPELVTGSEISFINGTWSLL